ncbi:MAG: poly(3-hydroxyalkanoate) depolymerase, partial [Oxalobacteraceae bacterium]
MKPPFPSAIANILKLTRGGDLKSATAAIQDMLGGKQPAQPPRPATSEVINLTGTGQREPAEALKQPEARKPSEARSPGGTFTQRSFGNAKGSLGYWLYMPPQVKPGMALVVMLHGCTQSPEDFARGTGMNALADEVGFLVAYPGQERAANAQKCWNWF